MFDDFKKTRMLNKLLSGQNQVSPRKACTRAFINFLFIFFLSVGSYSHQVSRQCQPATHADVPASDRPQPCPAAGPEDLLQARDVSLQLQHDQSRQLPTGIDRGGKSTRILY